MGTNLFTLLLAIGDINFLPETGCTAAVDAALTKMVFCSVVTELVTMLYPKPLRIFDDYPMFKI